MKRIVGIYAMILLVGILALVRNSALAQSSVTSLQFVHLAADPTLSPISVWAGVPVFGSTQFFQAAPSISFRGTTPAIVGVPNPFISGSQILVAQFVDSTLSANLTAVTNTTATPTVMNGQFTGLRLRRGANISLIRGVGDPANFLANPNGTNTRLTLSTLVDTATPPSNGVRLIFYHAVTDAPPIDVVVRETGEIIASQIAFDQVVAYNIPDGNYTFDVFRSSPRTLLASYSAPLTILGYTGRRVVLAASGFLDSARNRNGAGFGLIAIPNTDVTAMPFLLRTAAPPAAATVFPPISLQTVHASADPALSPIAFWLNTMPFGGAQFFPISTNLSFRTATPLRTSLAAGTLQVPLAGNTNRPTDALITAVTTGTLPGAGLVRVANYLFAPAANFTLIEGVLDTTRFARNPSGRSIRFQLRTLPDTATSVASNQTRIVLAHSVTDLGDILLDVRDASGTMLGTFGPLSYGLTFIPTALPSVNYTLSMRENGSNTVLGTFALNLQSENLAGKRVVLTATGFANRAQNQGGPGVRILAAVNDSTGRFFLLPGGFVSVREQISMSNSGAGMTLHAVSPNPVREAASVRYELAEAKELEFSLVDAQGQTVWSRERQFMASGAHSFSLEASTLAQGAYTLRLRDDRGNAVAVRLVVVR